MVAEQILEIELTRRGITVTPAAHTPTPTFENLHDKCLHLLLTHHLQLSGTKTTLWLTIVK